MGWKYDGFRAGARLSANGRVRLDSRNGTDFTTTFPEIAEALTAALPRGRVALDGEIVAAHPVTGVPDFDRLQQRLGANPSAALLAAIPTSYVLFDVLVIDDHPVTEQPYWRRRGLLAELDVSHPRLQVPQHQQGIAPQTLLEVAKAHHIEGIMWTVFEP